MISFSKLKWAVLWAVLIFVLCVMPGNRIPHVPFLEFHYFDKLVHLGLFYVQTILTIRGLSTQNRFKNVLSRAMLLSFVLCFLYGGMLELIQGAWCIDRTADVYDFFADVAGSILGIITYKKTMLLCCREHIN